MRRKGRTETGGGRFRLETGVAASVGRRVRVSPRAEHDHESDHEEEAVTADEVRTFRQEAAYEWCKDLPSRLRQFVSSSTNEITMRIFRDVIVRLPIADVNKEEVLSLVRGYGPVEYMNEMHRPTEAEEGDAVNMDQTLATYCHAVRFSEGIDALHCFISLNGALIDPAQHKMAYDDFVQLLQSEGLDVDTKALAEEVPSVIRPTDGTSLAFITVDFFRMAIVAPPKGCKRGFPGTIPRCGLSSAPSHGDATGFNAIYDRLREEAVDLAGLHPLVVSHEGILWEDFCQACNIYAFLHADLTQRAWNSVYEALKSEGFSLGKVLTRIECSRDEHGFITNSTAVTQKRVPWPSSRQAKIFIVVMLLLLLLSLFLYLYA